MGVHFGAFLAEPTSPKECPVAVISLFLEALPIPVPTEWGFERRVLAPAARFRKFACDPAHQGHGVGTALLSHTFEYAQKTLGCSVVWCDARAKTAKWYERRGMQRFGEIFYKGPIEYVRMKIEF